MMNHGGPGHPSSNNNNGRQRQEIKDMIFSAERPEPSKIQQHHQHQQPGYHSQPGQLRLVKPAQPHPDSYHRSTVKVAQPPTSMPRYVVQGPCIVQHPPSYQPRRDFLRSLLCCLGVSRRPTTRYTPHPQQEGSKERHIPVKQQQMEDDRDSNPDSTDSVFGSLPGVRTPVTSPVDNRIADVRTPPTCSGNLLAKALQIDMYRNCLIVDLDETLVHSSFKPVDNADYIVPVELDGVVHKVYVLKRPYVDQFLDRIGRIFECVLFTASLAKYADPVCDLLDPGQKTFRYRLFREACVYHDGSYIKDLGMLGRDLRRVVIIDNSPASFAFHPENAVAVTSWFDDPDDKELLYLLPFLERLSRVENVYTLLRMLRDRSGSPTSDDENMVELNGNSTSRQLQIQEQRI